MEKKRIYLLIEKYIEGSICNDEQLELMEWYRDSVNHEVIWPLNAEEDHESVKREMLKAIRSRTKTRQSPVIAMFKYWIKVAGILLLLIGLILGGFYLATNRNVKSKLTQDKGKNQNISPGKNGAVLLLSGGKQIRLSGLQSGPIDTAVLALVKKYNDSSIVFKVRNDTSSSEQDMALNVLYVPEGHQFQITLPDATKVWLNSGTKLKFPTVFNGKTRRVELEGEAYFEVVHNEKQPFEVVTLKSVVKDVGTEFNISAYIEDENVKTTLVNGIVDVAIKGSPKTKRLKPGEQAVVGKNINVGQVDLASVIGWKQGQFVFHSEPLKDIMIQISRWYNVEVIYKQDVSNKSVWGSISRNMPISEVLNMIELTGVAHFRIDGKSILVYK